MLHARHAGSSLSSDPHSTMQCALDARPCPKRLFWPLDARAFPFPPIARPSLSALRILVGWNGSREAIRAPANAMPLLMEAEAVLVIFVVEEPKTRGLLHGEEPGADICRHLVHGTVFQSRWNRCPRLQPVRHSWARQGNSALTCWSWGARIDNLQDQRDHPRRGNPDAFCGAPMFPSSCHSANAGAPRSSSTRRRGLLRRASGCNRGSDPAWIPVRTRKSRSVGVRVALVQMVRDAETSVSGLTKSGNWQRAHPLFKCNSLNSHRTVGVRRSVGFVRRIAIRRTNPTDLLTPTVRSKFKLLHLKRGHSLCQFPEHLRPDTDVSACRTICTRATLAPTDRLFHLRTGIHAGSEPRIAARCPPQSRVCSRARRPGCTGVHWDSRTGTSAHRRTVRVAPPRMISLIFECPYAPMNQQVSAEFPCLAQECLAGWSLGHLFQRDWNAVPDEMAADVRARALLHAVVPSSWALQRR